MIEINTVGRGLPCIPYENAPGSLGHTWVRHVTISDEAYAIKRRSTLKPELGLKIVDLSKRRQLVLFPPMIQADQL